jgi:hypothetical protein
MRPGVVIASTALLALQAAPLEAQFGQPGRNPYGSQQPIGRNQIPKFATTNELQSLNAAEALLKDAEKLKLTEAQVSQLSALRGTLYERNADLIARYDSVRRNFKVPKELENASSSGGALPSQEELQALGVQMRFMVNITDQLIQRRPEQVAECLALVDDSQRGRATKVLNDQTDDLKKATPRMPNNRGR